MRKINSEKWHVEKWSGGHGYAPGFYIANRACTVWLQTTNGRARRFDTREAAQAFIDSSHSITL